jgi:hypothetical protein
METRVMNERRHNWKEELGDEARKRAATRQTLLIQLEQIRADRKKCNPRDFETVDALALQMRETIAALATL